MRRIWSDRAVPSEVSRHLVSTRPAPQWNRVVGGNFQSEERIHRGLGGAQARSPEEEAAPGSSSSSGRPELDCPHQARQISGPEDRTPFALSAGIPSGFRMTLAITSSAAAARAGSMGAQSAGRMRRNLTLRTPAFGSQSPGTPAVGDHHRPLPQGHYD